MADLESIFPNIALLRYILHLSQLWYLEEPIYIDFCCLCPHCIRIVKQVCEEKTNNFKKNDNIKRKKFSAMIIYYLVNYLTGTCCSKNIFFFATKNIYVHNTALIIKYSQRQESPPVVVGNPQSRQFTVIKRKLVNAKFL